MDTGLLTTVYRCRRCLDNANAKRFAARFELVTLSNCCCPKKFPPTIGAEGQADLLFMGISPRLQDNYVLDWAMKHEHHFAELSAIRDQYGSNYLSKEPHYLPYIQIVEQLYPANTVFSTVAAVTDLYYCAYPAKDRDSYEPDYVSLRWKSPCAHDFFTLVFSQVQPKVIITRGAPPMDYLLTRFAGRRGHIPPPDCMSYPVTIDGVMTTIVSVRRASAAGFSCADRRWAVARIREALSQDKPSIYSCWKSAGE